MERVPAAPVSVHGVRPAIINMGTFSRAALITPQSALAEPTFTWTITACARPVASVAP